MYSQQRNRPNPSINAARLAAEAAFSAPPEPERPPEVASNALVIVKKKRSLDLDASVGPTVESHPDEINRGPRVFRVPTAALSELEGHGVDGHPHPLLIGSNTSDHGSLSEFAFSSNGNGSPNANLNANGSSSGSGSGNANGNFNRLNGNGHGSVHANGNGIDVDAPRTVHRRSRRSSVAKPGPVVTIVAAPVRESVDLAALARELQATANAREHAAAQEQLIRLQDQMAALDSVLAQIAKARAFTLNDMELSAQWQQLDQAAQQLGDSFPEA